MSIVITGSQFIKKGATKTYSVSSIPTGYTLGTVVLPTGWSVLSNSAIVTGAQSFSIKIGIGSGTIVISYTNGSNIVYAYYDVFCGSTRRGEEIKQDGAIVISSTASTTPFLTSCGVQRCPFVMEAYADADDPTNEYNNDVKDFYYYGDQSIASISITLQKLVNSAWVDKATLTDSTYGDFFAFGKSPDFLGNNFVDDFNKRYTGIQLEWLKVLIAFGDGMYRMKVIHTDIFTNVTTSYSQEQYYLYQWNCQKTNGTVRIDSYNQGLRGTLFDRNIQIDYYTGWNSQVRLRGLFLYAGSTYNKEYNQYGDKDNNIMKPIVHEQVPKYVLTKLYVPAWLTWYLSTTMAQADTIEITDHNVNNRFSLIKTPVIFDGDLSLNPDNLVDPSGDIMIDLRLEFKYAQNNLRKRNSY